MREVKNRFDPLERSRRGTSVPEGKLVNKFRIALANIRFPATSEESITLAVEAINQACIKGARILCFPECFIPGYRVGKPVPPNNPEFLERAWSVIAKAAAKANLTVVLGTERFVDGALVATALVINQDGIDRGLSGQGPDRPLRRGHLHTRLRPSRLSSRPLDFRCRDLPRRLAVSRDRPLGCTAWSTPCVSPALPRSGARFLPASGLRRSREYISREGGAVPRRREHLLFRNRQFRESRLSDHIGDRPSRWDTTQLPALR